MPSKSYILGIDIGTSSVRAALFDDRARQIRSTAAKREYSLESNPDGGSEVDAELLLGIVIDVIDEVHAKADRPIEHIASCSFWHSLMGVDKRGRPTTKVFMWADTRSREYTAQLRGRFDEKEVHNRTGSRFHSSFWPAKLLWVKNEFPNVWHRTERWISFADYIALRLCDSQEEMVGTRCFSDMGPSRGYFALDHVEREPQIFTSIGMASATGLFNQREDDWDNELLRFLEISPAELPILEVFPLPIKKSLSADRESLTGAKFHLTVGDGVASNLGSGCFKKSRAAINLGTSGAIRIAYEGEPPKSLPSGLWCYRVDKDRVIVGGALSDGGGLYAYLKKTLNVDLPDDAIGEEIARRGADAHGLTVMPFFFGERSTGYNEKARGYILGLNATHGVIDILQAAIESVAFRFAEILDQLTKVSKIDEIVVSGGALDASPVWTQIIADVLGRNLLVSNEPEASLRGAVLLALESLGKIDSIESFSHEKTQVAFHSKCHAIYKKARKRHVLAYKTLFADQK